MKLRIKFTKKGPLKFIGHLDIMRYFQKVMRRSEIDISYSGGFSPHQIMSFASPLGVGIESNGEYFDIEVESVTTSKDMMSRMNKEMAYGLSIVSVKKLDDTEKNAMASIAAAKYSVYPYENMKWPFDDVKQAIKEFMTLNEILFEKETKTGIKQIDLKLAIFSMEYEEQDDITIICDASSAGNIKPKMILDKMFAMNGFMFDSMKYHVVREDLYTFNKTSNSLISLGEIGEEIV